MSKEELVKGLKAIDDDDVRQRVAAGDIAAAGDLDLTSEESELLRGAAEDYPEVAGFASDFFLKIDLSDSLSLNFNKVQTYLTQD